MVVSLQDETDLENQKINLKEVAAMLAEKGVQHRQIATSDADESELRGKLPKAVALFANEIASAAPEGGVYVHCNGGRGRAPTIVAAYYFWLGGMTLQEAVSTVQAARKSSPKVGVISGATVDILGGSVTAEHVEDEGLTVEERAAVEAYVKAQAA